MEQVEDVLNVCVLVFPLLFSIPPKTIVRPVCVSIWDNDRALPGLADSEAEIQITPCDGRWKGDAVFLALVTTLTLI